MGETAIFCKSILWRHHPQAALEAATLPSYKIKFDRLLVLHFRNSTTTRLPPLRLRSGLKAFSAAPRSQWRRMQPYVIARIPPRLPVGRQELGLRSG